MNGIDLRGLARTAAPTSSPPARPTPRPGRSGSLRRHAAKLPAQSRHPATVSRQTPVVASPAPDSVLDDRMIVDPDFDSLDCLASDLLGGSFDDRGPTSWGEDD